MNPNDKALNRNAADESQVKSAAEKTKFRREQEIDDLNFVLQSKQGRRFLWRLLGHCKTFGSVWEASAKIHYNSGIQDVGHFVLSEIVQTNEDAYFKMMQESRELRNV